MAASLGKLGSSSSTRPARLGGGADEYVGGRVAGLTQCVTHILVHGE
jgi:hypothetical protein